jgi:hypothetical protein
MCIDIYTAARRNYCELTKFVPYRNHFCTYCNTVNVKVKVKVKFTLEQATKAQRGSIGIALLFL